jgi:hypothetical protein
MAPAAAWGSPTLSVSPIKAQQASTLSPRTLKLAEHNHVCKDYLIQLQLEQQGRVQEWAKEQRALETRMLRLKEVHHCAVFYLDNMTTKEMQYIESRIIWQSFHTWRGFNAKRAAFNKYARINARMNIREHRPILTFCFLAFQCNAREFVINTKLLNSDAKDPELPEPDPWKDAEEIIELVVHDPPPTEKQLRGYFTIWKCAVSFLRVEGVVKDDLGVKLQDSDARAEEEEEHIVPAPPEDKPVEMRRAMTRRISGVGLRRGSLSRKKSSITSGAETRMKAMLSSSSVGHGELRRALDMTGDEQANSVFLRREGFKGWRRYAKRCNAARAMLLQRLQGADEQLCDLGFQAWRYRHNIVQGNWTKAYAYAEGKDRALMSRVFSGWQQGAWRKKQEAIFRLRLEHAVWELTDARLSWETEVVRLEAELAAWTGLCPSDPQMAHSGKLRRPNPPPPLPKEIMNVGWEEDEHVQEDEEEEDE